MRYTLKNENASSENNYEHIKRFIKETMDFVNYIGFPRIFVDIAGDVKAALFLSQCVYWSDKGKRRDGYIYKSDKEFAMEIGLSLAEIKRVKRELTERGFIQVKLKKANGAPTTHYFVIIPMIEQAIKQYHDNQQMEELESKHSDLVKSDESITENTQQNYIHQITPQSESELSSSVTYSNKESLMESYNDEKYILGNKQHYLNGNHDDISKIEKEILDISGLSYLSSEEKERIKRIGEMIFHKEIDYVGIDEEQTWQEEKYDIMYIEDKLEWARRIYWKEGRRLKPAQILIAIEKPENQEKWRKYKFDKAKFDNTSRFVHNRRKRMRMIGEMELEESDKFGKIDE